MLILKIHTQRKIGRVGGKRRWLVRLLAFRFVSQVRNKFKSSIISDSFWMSHGFADKHWGSKAPALPQL